MTARSTSRSHVHAYLRDDPSVRVTVVSYDWPWNPHNDAMRAMRRLRPDLDLVAARSAFDHGDKPAVVLIECTRSACRPRYV